MLRECSGNAQVSLPPAQVKAAAHLQRLKRNQRKKHDDCDYRVDNYEFSAIRLVSFAAFAQAQVNVVPDFP